MLDFHLKHTIQLVEQEYLDSDIGVVSIIHKGHKINGGVALQSLKEA